MNIRFKILEDFRQGKTIQQISKKYSAKTVYRYYKLFLLIRIRETIQQIIDSERFDVQKVPILKQNLTEVKEW